MTSLVGLDLAGRRVVVVGGGPIAARRVQALLLESPRVLVVAPQLCEELAELVHDGRVEWRAGEVAAADLDGAWLVQTATGDRATDAVVVGWASERRVFCVNLGDASSGSARTPATTVSGDVLVGVVSTGAADPRRSASVRDQLAEHLRDGRVDLRRGRVRVPGTGSVVLVGGGPGAVDLLTLRGRRALAEADVVVTDRLGPTSVLDELPGDVEVIHVGKTSGHHPVPQHEINQILVERALRGERVVRLKGGDPFLYGRGGEEVLACRAAGVPVEVVAGVSSAFAAPLAAGIPLTHRGTVAAVQVVHGHEALSSSALAGLRESSLTLVVLMGVSLLAEMAAAALAAGVDPQTPVAIVENGTMPAQRITRAPLARIAAVAAEVGVRSPAVIVLGAVAAEGLLDAPADTRPTHARVTLAQ
ncbi:MAG TPA: uroporphyrinogen-III C-methyltransferase [Cellulomonas sp.]|uniref:uroporphyrinogen-III C-methyltransferase n=1 Tax=Cellulomonas sp. TaxID=40001 RepID=UPI002E3286BC|nr:uroporphyrinogen-III C-methyltransferase [Cellulomonas sp.]HEX5331730.1 uroporphyrinogen-III C-methyltransferase [Cellulomonas sp.]